MGSSNAEEGAKNADMTDKVGMICQLCGADVHYIIRRSCPSCGMIEISCPKCEYTYEFGE